jgi:ubiquinone/menaquinone biosynthesis C-methylase UbiE
VSSFKDLSGFYDLDYPDTSDHAFLRQIVSAAHSRHLLEIPCGSGRNVVPLLDSSSGNVTFVDIAETMVNETSKRIPQSARKRARAIVGDIRSLDTGSEFDMIICPREAFQLLNLREAAQALHSMAAAIADEGLIVIDLFNFTHDPGLPSDTPPDYFSPVEHGWVEDWTRTAADRSLTVTRRRRQRFTASGVHFDMHYVLWTPAKPDPTSVHLAFHLTNYSSETFCELASQSGLDVLATFAGYNRAPIKTSASLRTVFVLGHDRYQNGGERLNRICGEIASDRRVSKAYRSDARRSGGLDICQGISNQPGA